MKDVFCIVAPIVGVLLVLLFIIFSIPPLTYYVGMWARYWGVS